jgi:putative tryptophan/tyrosine transport system substrate-binding protein
MWYSAVGFLVTLTLSLLAAPLTADAQTLAKIPRIGIMGDWPEDSPNWGVFRQGLRELGYVEGHNIAIEWRFTAHGSLKFGGVSKIVVRSLALYNRTPS